MGSIPAGLTTPFGGFQTPNTNPFVRRMICAMSSNGNGRKGSHPPVTRDVIERTALDEVTDHLEALAAEESMEIEEIPGPPRNPPSDPVLSWRHSPVTLDTLHQGLISVSQISEAAIEGGLKMASDLKRALPQIERSAIQIEALAAKVESNYWHTHQVDEDLAKMAKTLNVVKRTVQAIKDDVAEMKGPVSQIPAIKDLLGEILARLPERS